MKLQRTGDGGAGGRRRDSSANGAVAARPQLIRAMNEQMLLQQVRQSGPVSRADLARLSGLSKPTVGLALANLERDALVRAAGHRTGVRGPAALLYEVRPEAGYVLGLDVGREYLRGALADLTGAVRAKVSRRSHDASAHARMEELTSLADELTATAGIKRSKVSQTVVGSPGVYDPRKGAITMAGNLPGWERPDVIASLKQLFGRSVVVENDVDLAALAERDLGHGREVQTFCFVSVGTGVGMGLVIDGRLHRGAHGAAGEIAYLPIAADADVDEREARRRGTFEASAAAAAVVRAARGAGVRGVLSARRVFAAAAGGDERAKAIVAEEAHLLARAIASIAAVVDPELVVLGGGIGGAPGFAMAVADALESLAPFAPEIRVSALGDDAVVDGCLAAGLELAWERVLERS